MQPKIITSFFTSSGVPATGLSPTIRIWTVDVGTQVRIITDAPMLEVGDGFYKYDFSTYNNLLDYVVRSDGGVTLKPQDRYQIGANENFADDIADFVWDESKIEHINPGSMGESVNAIDANVDQLRLDVTSMLNLVQLLVKYEQNHTRIDKIDKTLTVYDDDGITPIQVFDLYDSTGTPSVEEVCERVPQ